VAGATHMDYVFTAADRALFKRCRRAWDFGSPLRQNLEPAAFGGIDAGDAVREGLAVYYFPGMWEWHNRSIVERLSIEAFDRTLRRQRAAAGEEPGLSEQAWHDARELGTSLLRRYFRWAPSVDRFSPIRVHTDFAVTVPDPDRQEADLVSAGNQRLVYTGTIDMLVIDQNDAYWLVNHRVTTGEWSEVDLLVLDDVYASYCWAWESFFLGMRIAGVQYNEIRLDLEDGSVPDDQESEAAGAAATHMGGVAPIRRMYLHAAAVPTEIRQQQDGPFRRTVIPRSPRELAGLRKQMAGEALELSDPAVRIYPTPSPGNCRACAFRAPCLVVNEGDEPDQIVASAYRRRPDAEPGAEPRIGSATWSQNRGAAPLGWEERVKRPDEFLPAETISAESPGDQDPNGT
jgi:hypothetical protein